MDFLEDLELYERAMQNAYMLITKKKTIDDFYYDLESEDIIDLPLPFNPLQTDGRHTDVIDVVIEYFTSTEEYEKCAELVKIKKKCSKTQTESDQPPLTL
tara:strand:- start:21 stop:320 length:300 start_codon:yes stop_codon:yes gene_type:complete